MRTVRSLRPLIVIMAALAGIFLFFYRFYHNDMMALKGFTAGYEAFDRALSELSAGGTEDADRRAGEALAGLRARASLKLSSMIRNEREAMAQAAAIAELSERKLASLRAYQRAVRDQGADADGLSKEVGDLGRQRRAACARFRALGRQRP